MKARLAAVLLSGYLVSATAQAPTLQPLAVLRADGVRVELVVEVARSEEERRVGLMTRSELARGRGMLFDFHKPTVATMWMKNTPLALDMLFLDAQGKVVWIAARTSPNSRQLISAPQLVRYVLELRGGDAQALGLALGDRVLVPSSAAASSAELPPTP